jgi:lipopolysaccharide cholinephosphotransferase
MKPITPEEVRQIQCEMLSDVADFCEKSNLTYFLAYGTLIGAIRHNGFIPWDDDIDIAMPRPDYDKFINSYNNRSSFNRVVDFSIDDSYGVSFAKVYDCRTWLNEYKYKEEKFGVYIDIFPIDGVNGKWQMYKAKKLDKLLHVKKANFKKRSFFRNLVNCIIKFLLLPFSVNDILKCCDKNARQYPFGTTPLAGNMLETYGTCEIVETSVFCSTLFHKFEDKEYRIPVGYDKWLSSIYGDYMQLPPKDQQVAHHAFDVYWKD